MARHLHIDPFAGIAGDMFLGALLDLGVPLEAMATPLQALPIGSQFKLTADETHRHTLRGIDFKVHAAARAAAVNEHEHEHEHSHDHQDHHHEHQHAHGGEEPAHQHSHSTSRSYSHSHGHAHRHDHNHAHGDGAGPAHGHGHAHGDGAGHDHHHHTGPREILAMIDQLDAADRAKERARRVVRVLAEAEAAVHGMSVEQVHFHEVGAVDSIVDMLAAAVALEWLDVATLSCGPLPIGQGFVRCAHGLMPLPAPATANLLRGIAHFGVERRGETVTPTGAALIAGLVPPEQVGPMPAMRVERIGYGAGDRDDPEIPNLLRVHLGERLA